MAARNRDAIFELVVLKEKQDQKEREAEISQGYQNIEVFKNGLSEAAGSILQSGPEGEAAGSVQIGPEGNETGGRITQTDGQEASRSAPELPRGNLNGAIVDSFDNATYSSTYFGSDDKKKVIKKENNVPNTTKWLLLFLSLTVLILIALLIAGLSLTSVNKNELAELQQTAVSNTSYQMANAGFLEMLNSLQAQVKQLNESIQRLSENLSQISRQVNQTDSVLAERIDSIEAETKIETNQLNLALTNQSSRINELREDLINSDLRLSNLTTQLSDSLGQVESDIDDLENRTSQPVDVFKNCTSIVASNETLTLSSSDLMYDALTTPVNAAGNVSS